MRSGFLFIVLFVFAQNLWARPSYKEAKKILVEMPEHIKEVVQVAPQTYEFKSRFAEASGLSYKSQVFENILIDGLKAFMGSLERGGYSGSSLQLISALNSYLEFTPDRDVIVPKSIHGDSPHGLKIKDVRGGRIPSDEGLTYDSILPSGSRLIDQIAGNSAPLEPWELMGWRNSGRWDLLSLDIDKKGDTFVEPEDLVHAIFQKISQTATTGRPFSVPNGDKDIQRVRKAYVTEEAVDLNQIVNKFLQVSGPFAQVVGNYLNDSEDGHGLLADNEDPYEVEALSTALEQFWDQAFGYLGAARSFSVYTDEQVVQKVSIDPNRDGEISILRELNFSGVLRNSSRMDLMVQTYGEGEMDLSGGLIESFLKGRELIQKKPDGYLDYVKAYAAIIVGLWERTLAATSIHYINVTVKTMDQYGSDEYIFTNYAKSWSEMKGFSMAFQFNSTSELTSDKFEEFHTLVGEQPVLPEDKNFGEYRSALIKARGFLQEAFGFSEENAKIF